MRYPKDQKVTLIATAYPGWCFAGWKTPVAGKGRLWDAELKVDIICEPIFEPDRVRSVASVPPEEIKIEESHVYLMLNGSASMKNPHCSGELKHFAVAKTVQGIINELHDDDCIQNTMLTIICWDSNKIDDVRLLEYDVKQHLHYYENYDPNTVKPDDEKIKRWDPLIGHGCEAPTGRALAFAREMAQMWVEAANGLVYRRAVIGLLSDGQTWPANESNGLDQKDAFAKFYTQNEKTKGIIRLFTVGYFQQPGGGNDAEKAACAVLKELVLNPSAYIESDVSQCSICQYLYNDLAPELDCDREYSPSVPSEVICEESHVFLLLCGSRNMKCNDATGEPKHVAVAKMVQGLINEFHDDAAFENTLLTVICWDSNKIDDVRLLEYDVKQHHHYYENYDPTTVKSDDEKLKLWDPLDKHGGATPTGRALEFARWMAESWVRCAERSNRRIATISLLSDGKTFPENESSGLDQKALIAKFNENNRHKGLVRLITIGYFQKNTGCGHPEDADRAALKELVLSPALYKETNNAREIACYCMPPSYLLWT